MEARRKKGLNITIPQARVLFATHQVPFLAKCSTINRIGVDFVEDSALVKVAGVEAVEGGSVSSVASQVTLPSFAPRSRGRRWSRLRLYRLGKQINRKLVCCDTKILFHFFHELLKKQGDSFMDQLASRLVTCDNYVIKTLGSYAVSLKLTGCTVDGQAPMWKPIGSVGNYLVDEHMRQGGVAR